EYYRAGKPIFALADPAGISAQMLRDVGVQDIADIADQAAIATTLENLLDAMRRKARAGVAREAAALNSRKSRTAELARLLDQFIK
ncbi:MAG TPA: glycosyltransferase, partial [Azonexus sp.]|nr:glycosyltransferase [Azonexus sp.]